jgi:hypothetical protein
MDAITIERSVELDAAAEQVWAAARTPAAFRYVTRGVLRITGLPRTGTIGEDTRIDGWLLLGGVLPVHRHHLEVVRVDEAAMTLSSNEWGGSCGAGTTTSSSHRSTVAGAATPTVW